MGNSLTKLFGIDEEEKGLISTLLIQSVFIGIFFGVFNITAHSLFLSRFDETYLARAYAISGVAGITLTSIYTVLQSRMKFTGFAILNLTFIMLLTLSLWILMLMKPAEWVIFGIFIMLGPLNILALLGFYGTAGRIFTLRQGKRLFGIIDTGYVVGAIISSFAIPGLLSLNIQPRDLLLISAAGAFGAVIVQFFIGHNYKGAILASTSGGESRAKLSVFRKDRYIRTMGLFIAFSMLMMFFVMYSFMAVTRERFPEEQEMANFLGLFEGTMMVFTLLIKTFIFSYLIKNQGLKVTLAVAPVLIAIFTVVAIIIGTTRGFTPEASGFMLFFMILAISRLFSKALKDSVEVPAFKVLYQTLSEKIRYGVQSAIDGTVNEIAALASGLILSGLSALAFVKLIHFSWVLFGILVIWIILAIRLYNEYRGSVQKSLESTDISETGEEEIKEAVDTGTGIALELKNNYYDIINPNGYFEKIKSNPGFISSVIRHAETGENPDILPLLGRLREVVTEDETINRIDIQIERFRMMTDKISGIESDDLSSVMETREDRKFVARALFATGRQPVITDLLRLIRENDNDIKKETIYLIGKLKLADLLPEVCDCLNKEETAPDAYCVLRSFGEDAFEALSSHYFRSTGHTQVQKLIIRLFGESGTEAANEFLLPRIWSVHRSLRKEAVNALLKCHFKPSQETSDRLLQEIQEVIGLITWNISAGITLKTAGNNDLAEALSEDTEWWRSFLFDLLSIVYDRHSFDKIRENLSGGTVESVNFALEMLDIVVDESIKPRLNSLLDVVSDEEKLKNLFQFYPGSIPEYNELVEDLVNKDYNHISAWTKVCAMRSLYDIPKPDNIDFIVALLFSPVKILREEGVRYIREKDIDIFTSCSYRIPPKFTEHIEMVIKGDISDRMEIYRKLNYIKELLGNIPENNLIALASEMMVINEPAEVKEHHLDHDFIAWSINEEGDERGPFTNWNDLGIKLDSDSKYEKISYPLYILDTRFIARMVFNEPGLKNELIMQFDRTA